MNKKRIYEILEKADPGDMPSRVFDIFIMTLISLNVIVVIIDTVPSIERAFSRVFYYFEVFSVVVFTIEYLLRIWSCTIDDGYRNSVTGRIKFILSPMALIDLFAILPFYIPVLIPFDLRSIRAVRLFRLFRLFKMGRYSRAMQTLGFVIRRKKEELLITFFAVIVLLIIASTLMFYVENEQQPEAFSSIPSAMWWGVATLTTVGYGDVYPVTVVGKLLGAFIALLGIGLFAMPAGILASGFSEAIKGDRSEKVVCSRCGEEIEGDKSEK